jgi:hypothetical protein
VSTPAEDYAALYERFRREHPAEIHPERTKRTGPRLVDEANASAAPAVDPTLDMFGATRVDAVEAAQAAPQAPTVGRDTRGMVRHDSPVTSQRAAESVLPHLTELHERVLLAFRMHGTLTDEELERLPEFTDYSPSTIRKRRSELYRDHKRLCENGATRPNARGTAELTVWRLAPTPPNPERVGPITDRVRKDWEG